MFYGFMVYSKRADSSTWRIHSSSTSLPQLRTRSTQDQCCQLNFAYGYCTLLSPYLGTAHSHRVRCAPPNTVQ